MAPRLLSETRFASFLVYFPHAKHAGLRDTSLELRDGVKFDQARTIERAARRLRELWDEDEVAPIRGILGSTTLLIPAPRSSPLRDPRSLWPPRRICEELVKVGLGAGLAPCLERMSAVPKAAFLKSERRPRAPEHYSSIAFHHEVLPAHKSVTVVDDIVTTGATLLACVSRVQENLGAVEVRAFALLRLMSDEPLFGPREEFPLREPCAGTIRYSQEKNWCFRVP